MARRLGEPMNAAPGAPCSTPCRLALLLDLGRLAAQVTQVVELRSADVTARDDLDLGDDRRVHREGALDTDAEADLADREGLPDAAALPADHHALEDLDALA